MQLGAFSISLSVKDIEASKTFYEGLGFQAMMGDITQNWLIMKNGDRVIGLFQGMFEKNILTFNPGWDQSGQPLEDFTDIRAIQSELKENGIVIPDEVDVDTEGPASFMIYDPDGNPILIDQHV